jgi:hypothetical protein
METTGAINDHLDVALIVLYAFWIFFFGLLSYCNSNAGFKP